MDAETIAKGLSEGQRRYLIAVGDAGAPYEPRHGVTANWALRHNYVDSIVRLNDGREGPWDSFPLPERFDVGIDCFLGQALTEKGIAVRAILKGE
jgi:hypothetical protein